MDSNKIDKKRTLKSLKLFLILIIWIISISLCIIWYDWKLVFILVFFGWANNILLLENKISPLEDMIDLIKESIDFK